MDEPSSGLDPASRKNLWKAVKSAKQDRTIVLTSTVFAPGKFRFLVYKFQTYERFTSKSSYFHLPS
jgi:hypothetical protein